MMSQGEKTWTSGLIPMIEPEIVSEIISRIADLALVISSSGIVLGILSNPSFKLRLGLARWEGQPLVAHLNVESVPKFEERLATFLENGDALVRPIELNHSATEGQPEFPVRYSFHRIGTDGAILMLGHDLRPIAEMQQQLVSAQIALEKDYEMQREYDTRLRVLMGAMQEGTIYAALGSGEITDCNAVAGRMLDRQRSDLIGATLVDVFNCGGEDGILDTLVRAAGAQSANGIAISTKAGRRVNLRPTLFRLAGEQMLLCQIVDEESKPAQTDNREDMLSALYERGTDGIVFITKAGVILSANDAFLRFSGIVHNEAVKGRAISDFLARGSVDQNVITENARRTGSMRLYATRLIGENGTELPIEIATTMIGTAGESVFSLVIRDASRADLMRDPQNGISDVDSRSVIELIGTQTLKGIVAKTTDVIEKMCIETAVELTSNNRVAAAEMLGLSRQSLYVKLRKYDLLKRGGE